MVLPRSAAAHVVVDDLDRLEIGPDDEHHLRRVLRISPDQEVTATDGKGSWRVCRLEKSLEAVGAIQADNRAAPQIGIAFALTQNVKADWAAQKLTEVGVDRIIPMITARSVVRWEPEKIEKNHLRFQRVVKEAMMQCRRVWAPVVSRPVHFDELIKSSPGLAMADPEGEPPQLDTPTLLIGPEGGWDPRELASRLPRVRLGEAVMRTETAALAGGILLAGLRSGLGARVPSH